MASDELTREQLTRLLDVGRSLVSELDLESLLSKVLETARDLTRARYAALGILDERKTGLERFLNRGVDEDTRRTIGPLPQGRGVLGEVIRNPEPLRLSRVGDHPHSYGFPPGHPRMDTFVGVPIRIGSDVFGNLYLTEKEDGAEFDERDEAMLVILADFAAVAIDNARTHEESETRMAQQARTVEALEATASLSRVVVAETGIEWLLELIVKRGRALLDCELMLAMVPEDDEGVRVAAAAGQGAPGLAGRRVSAQHTLLISAGQDEGIQHVHGGRSSLFDDLGLAGRSSMVAGLTQQGVVHGFILAIGPLNREDFSEEDELAFDSFASSSTTSLSTAQDVERDRLRRSMQAAELERKRWAMELHDETLQDLGALKLIAESALTREDPDALRTAIESGIAQLEDTISGLESLINELRPASLDELGTGAAIEALVERIDARTDMSVEADVDLAFERGDAATRHVPELEAVIYRLTQEALNNAAKHADATRVTVRIQETNGNVEIEVADDGRGFDPAGAGVDRFGLHGMRERVAIAEGELELDSAEGKGTRVRARLPVRLRGATG